MKRLLTLCLILAFQIGHSQTPVSPSAGATSVTSVQKTTPSAEEKAVLAVEKQRFEAQVSKNYAVLEQVLANDLIYTHSHGGTDTKQSFIQSIRDGKQTYDAIDAQEQNVRLYGSTAIVNGVCAVKITKNGETINMRLRYTDVYIRKGSQWQMVAWQSLWLAN